MESKIKKSVVQTDDIQKSPVSLGLFSLMPVWMLPILPEPVFHWPLKLLSPLKYDKLKTVYLENVSPDLKYSFQLNRFEKPREMIAIFVYCEWIYLLLTVASSLCFRSAMSDA